MIRNCPKCGKAVKPESKFCMSCAFDLRQAQQQQSESAPQKPPDSLYLPLDQAIQQNEAARQAVSAGEPQPVQDTPNVQPVQPPPVIEQAASAPATELPAPGRCPNCKSAVKPNQKFCMTCAAPLMVGAQPQQAPPSPQAPQMGGQAARMAAQPAAEYSAPRPAGSIQKMLIIAIVAVVVLAGGGVGAYFFFKGKAVESANANAQGNNPVSTENSNKQTPPPRIAATAEEAAKMALQAMKDGDLATLKGLSAKSKPGLADEVINDVNAKKGEKGAIKGYRIINTFQASANSEIVVFAIEWTNGAPSGGRIDAVKEDGSWKIELVSQT